MCKIALAGVQIITALLPLTIICIMRLLEFGACSFVYNQLWIVRQCPPFLPPEMAQQGGHFANPIIQLFPRPAVCLQVSGVTDTGIDMDSCHFWDPEFVDYKTSNVSSTMGDTLEFQQFKSSEHRKESSWRQEIAGGMTRLQKDVLHARHPLLVHQIFALSSKRFDECPLSAQ
eukprot:1157812-Pelagomonas_calceolata.AAC.11